MSSPRVSALILSRQRPDRLRGCLRSLLAQDFTDREILVLANGCPETAALVRAEFPDVRLVELDENIGSAPGRDRIAGEATGKYFLFLDDDGELRSPDILSRCVAEADARPRVGLLSMSLLNADDDEPTGWRLNVKGLSYPCFHASFAGGACLVRATAFREAGGYCTLFSGPSEEFDLTVRLYGTGWAVLHFPDVEFHHFVDKTDEQWRVLVSQGYCHLQLIVWRLYPAPWHLTAAAKAFVTQLGIDVLHHGGRHLLSEIRGAWAGARVGRQHRAPISRAQLASLYAAKYYRINDWPTLERARRGVLLRLPFLRILRKLRAVPKLPLPRRAR